MNNAPFYIGQEVVAVRDHPTKDFKKGNDFTISLLRKPCSPCGRKLWLVSLHGIDGWYDHSYFSPKLDLSETTVEEFIENMEIAEYHTLDI